MTGLLTPSLGGGVLNSTKVGLSVLAFYRLSVRSSELGLRLNDKRPFHLRETTFADFSRDDRI